MSTEIKIDVRIPRSKLNGLEAELYEALKFYADPRKYRGPNGTPDPDEETVAGGNKARAAIAFVDGDK